MRKLWGHPWVVGIATGIIAAIAVKAVSLMLTRESWLYLWQHFVVELWPLWVGVIAVLIYLSVSEAIGYYRLRRWLAIHATSSANVSLAKWIRDRPTTAPHRMRHSLEERLMVIFEWWEAEGKKHAAP